MASRAPGRQYRPLSLTVFRYWVDGAAKLRWHSISLRTFQSRAKLLAYRPRRDHIAVAICVLGAAFGAFAIRRGWGGVSSVAFWVAGIWLFSGGWLSGDFTREGWRHLNKPMGAIYLDARQRKLRKTPPFVRTMNCGGLIMIVAGIVGWFF